MKNMIVGINYPWFYYGWDFGDPPLTWIGAQTLREWREQKRQQIRDDFSGFAKLGISAVRWFLLADGLNYGLLDDAPQTDGSEWSFHPLPQTHPFHQSLCHDFEFVLQTCAELKLQLVPSLIDFHFCFPGIVVDANAGVVKSGRADILNDAAKREMFLDNVLEPLLSISMKYPQTIFAWEPINEPEWCTQQKGFFSLGQAHNPHQTIPRDTMRKFITEAVARINQRRAFDSTIGFAHWETIDNWQMTDCGISLQQFHYYAQDNQPLPACRADWNAPCFVGEFATAVERLWPELQQAGMEQMLADRLRQIEAKGFKAAFPWSARATDQATLWSSMQHEELLTYLSGPATNSSDSA